MTIKVPYTTKTGLQIGLLYEPPRQNYMSADQERLQKALLSTSRQELSKAFFSMLAQIRGRK